MSKANEHINVSAYAISFEENNLLLKVALVKKNIMVHIKTTKQNKTQQEALCWCDDP